MSKDDDIIDLASGVMPEASVIIVGVPKLKRHGDGIMTTYRMAQIMYIGRRQTLGTGSAGFNAFSS